MREVFEALERYIDLISEHDEQIEVTEYMGPTNKLNFLDEHPPEDAPIGRRLYFLADNGLLSRELIDWVRDNVRPDQEELPPEHQEFIETQSERYEGKPALYFNIQTVVEYKGRSVYLNWDDVTPVKQCDKRAGRDMIGCINGIYWQWGYEQALVCARCKGKGYMSEADVQAWNYYRKLTDRPVEVIASGAKVDRSDYALERMVRQIIEVYRAGGIEGLLEIDEWGDPLEDPAAASAADKLAHALFMKGLGGITDTDD